MGISSIKNRASLHSRIIGSVRDESVRFLKVSEIKKFIGSIFNIRPSLWKILVDNKKNVWYNVSIFPTTINDQSAINSLFSEK